MDQDGGRRRAPSLPGTITALTDDLLRDILFRLPPHPFHLASASCVSKDRRRVVRDHDFLDRVRRHHRSPAVVGFFDNRPDPRFPRPTLVGGRERFVARIPFGRWWMYGCRHGRVLLHERHTGMLLVSDLITRENHYLPLPPSFRAGCESLGTVLCADDHEHGDCHARPFLVAFMFVNPGRSATHACVYSSETHEWGAVACLSLAFAFIDMEVMHTALVGRTIYWMVSGYQILKYDLDSHTLDLVNESPFYVYTCCVDGMLLLPAEDGGLGIAAVRGFYLRFWSRKPNNDGVIEWKIYRSIDLRQFVKPEQMKIIIEKNLPLRTIAIAEGADVIFISVTYSVYSLHLRSLEFKEVLRGVYINRMIHPYSAFYTAGANAGAEDGPANLAGAVNLI